LHALEKSNAEDLTILEEMIVSQSSADPSDSRALVSMDPASASASMVTGTLLLEEEVSLRAQLVGERSAKSAAEAEIGHLQKRLATVEEEALTLHLEAKREVSELKADKVRLQQEGDETRAAAQQQLQMQLQQHASERASLKAAAEESRAQAEVRVVSFPYHFPIILFCFSMYHVHSYILLLCIIRIIGIIHSNLETRLSHSIPHETWNQRLVSMRKSDSLPRWKTR
jgi:hypothetical protein